MAIIARVVVASLLSAWILIAPSVYAAGAGASTQNPLLLLKPEKPANVAIIGAGAAGSSAAYYLSKDAQMHNVSLNVTIFDRNPYIGGRSTTVDAYGNTALPVELGASIFVQVNQILVSAALDFNLSTTSTSTRAVPPGPEVGVWDGKQFHIIFNGGWWDLAKLVWKYGYAPIKTRNLMKKTVDKFLTMYDDPVFPFASLTQAAQDVGLLAVTAATGEQLMRENGITGSFGTDVVQASTRVNYAQNLASIHGLEAMVCMATDGAMQIEGGNWQIFDRMVKASKATTMLNTSVTGVEKQPNGSFLLEFENSGSISSSSSQSFDSVIIATPYQFSNITSHSTTAEPDNIPYVTLHVTLFTSPHLLSPAFFRLSPDQPVPRAVLTTLAEGERPKRGAASVGSPGFFSISLLESIVNPSTGGQEYIYKIFSPSAPTSPFIASILGVQDRPGNSDDELSPQDVTWIYRKIWQSYPYEYPRVTFEAIELDDDLWYTGGMDSFISTMETNALMGRNVARLLVERARIDGKHGL